MSVKLAETYWRAGSVWSSYIAGSVKMSKVMMRGTTITRCKFIWEPFSSNSVDGACEVAVCNSCISSLNTPKWFTVCKWRENVKMHSLCCFQKDNRLVRANLRSPTVAEGLKTISAPLTPNISQFSGWWRP